MHLSRLYQLALINALLAGCTVGPRYVAPQDNLPCSWQTNLTDGVSTESSECFVWWTALNDPMLTALINRAATQNLDLQIAAARICESRLEQKGKSAECYPRIDGSLGYGHVYYNTDTLSDILNCREKHHGHKNVDVFEAGFDIEWEIDLFGARAHEVQAAKAQVEAAEANFYAVWISLAAEIGRNYVELRNLQQRLCLLDQNIAAQKDTVQLTNDTIQIGTGSTIDLGQAQEQQHTLEAQRPVIKLAIEKTLHRLSVLVGKMPGDLVCELSVPGIVPELPCEKPIGLPSELLRRRPDIRKAERELAAATEMVGSAVASLFPRLSLYGFIGDITTNFPSLFNGASFAAYAGPQFLLPIFNSRLLEQHVDYNKLKNKEALLTYQKTVLEALEETENAIAAYQYELERHVSLKQAAELSDANYRKIHELYQKGFKSYLEVQVANRAFLTAHDAFVISQSDLVLHYIALYKAIGGGWDITQCVSEQE